MIEMEEYERLQDASRRRVRETSLKLTRFLMEKIDWRDRLIAITGARGTGKTTLILQHIKQQFGANTDNALYISLDNLWFETHSLPELIHFHYQNGGTHLFIDEVHYLNNWQKIIKNAYDDYPGLHIVYTGSSLLKIDADNADLSRRQIGYLLPGLSFREYLMFEKVYTQKAMTLPELLAGHVETACRITESIKILRYFREYLIKGYYPYYKEVFAGYDIRLLQIINQVLESDYPAVERINYSTVQKIKKMLYILAQSCPQTPNMAELYRELETDRNQGLKMLSILQKADLLNLLSSEKASLKNLSRPEKIYCNNTNIMYALTGKTDTETVRETFFLNQLRAAGHTVLYPPKGDFFVDNRYLFEIGGTRKTFDQIKDIPDSYLAIDDEEVGRRSRIPLWMFGLLY